MCDRDDEDYQLLASEEEVYTMDQLYEEQVYVTQEPSQGLPTYNFRRRDRSPQTTSLPPNNQ